MRPFTNTFLAMLLAAGTSAIAQGYYEPIPYYGNNPFLFCTLGVPTDCWAPVNPATGTFVVTNQYCFNAYSASVYARVCPRAFVAPTGSLDTGSPAVALLAPRSPNTRHCAVAAPLIAEAS